MATTATPRYVLRALRVQGWYILDNHTGYPTPYVGLAYAGALAIADHLNRKEQRAADAGRGTWRAGWISQQDDNALFGIEQDAEQGALFAI